MFFFRLLSGLEVSQEKVLVKEASSIIWALPAPLPLTASYQDRNIGSASREEGQIRRIQSAQSLSGSRGGRGKLTAAHIGSRTLRIAGDESVAVYYLSRTFEELQELEGTA